MHMTEAEKHAWIMDASSDGLGGAETGGLVHGLVYSCSGTLAATSAQRSHAVARRDNEPNTNSERAHTVHRPASTLASKGHARDDAVSEAVSL